MVEKVEACLADYFDNKTYVILEVGKPDPDGDKVLSMVVESGKITVYYKNMRNKGIVGDYPIYDFKIFSKKEEWIETLLEEKERY